MAPLVFLVAPSERRLYREVVRGFAGTDDVEVIVDRRVGERRQSVTPVPGAERRGGDRRARREVDEDLRVLGWALVPEI